MLSKEEFLVEFCVRPKLAACRHYSHPICNEELDVSRICCCPPSPRARFTLYPTTTYGDPVALSNHLTRSTIRHAANGDHR